MKRFFVITALILAISTSLSAADNGKNASSKWVEGVSYTYYSDGSCKPYEGRVCLDFDQYKEICKATKRIDQSAFETAKSLYLTSVGQQFFDGGNVSFYGISWKGTGCVTGWEARGVLQGSSHRETLIFEIKTFQKRNGVMTGTYLYKI